jgi:VCBS repeat-containing protein
LDTSTPDGSLTLNSDGSFDYSPDENFCGSDSFTYHANDGQEDSNMVTVTLNITCVNDAPIVVDQNAKLVSGSHLYPESGQYSVTITFTDDDGATAEQSFTVTVSAFGYSIHLPIVMQ